MNNEQQLYMSQNQHLNLISAEVDGSLVVQVNGGRMTSIDRAK